MLRFHEAHSHIKTKEYVLLIGISAILSALLNAFFGNNIFEKYTEGSAWFWVIFGTLIIGVIIYLIVVIYELCSERKVHDKNEEEMKDLLNHT